MLTRQAPKLEWTLGLSAHGFHRLAMHTWGPPDSVEATTICVHGLTRTGRDFDRLAEALAKDRRVLCPDVAGRGRSDWLATAEAYGYPQYNADMTAVLARSDAERVDWVGTSMGGLIGMMLAAQPGTPIRRLVLNDIGPFVPASALRRLAEYVGGNPHFPTFADAVAYIREVHAPFGALSEAQWRHLAEHAVRADPAGGYRLAYDPKIAAPLADPEAIEDIDLWDLWKAITCPVLVLRGADSDLLTPETARDMAKGRAQVAVREIAGAGHAPALLDDDQIAAVCDWLREGRSS